MASITLRMAIFSIFGDFLALKPSPFFQMGEISASVRHEARSDRGRKVPAKEMAKSTKYGHSGAYYGHFPCFSGYVALKYEYLRL